MPNISVRPFWTALQTKHSAFQNMNFFSLAGILAILDPQLQRQGRNDMYFAPHISMAKNEIPSQLSRSSVDKIFVSFIIVLHHSQVFLLWTEFDEWNVFCSESSIQKPWNTAFMVTLTWKCSQLFLQTQCHGYDRDPRQNLTLIMDVNFITVSPFYAGGSLSDEALSWQEQADGRVEARQRHAQVSLVWSFFD
jgi:hypothetical protein